jgi:heme-degrading monooxygenase HmoA
MHAVVVRVSIGDVNVATPELRERVVPRAKGAPGFVAGYWTQSDDRDNGLSMVVFDSEDNAKAAAELIRTAGVVAETVTLESVEVREVVANA